MSQHIILIVHPPLSLHPRYPPFKGTNKQAQFAKMSALKPDFDRQGRVKTNIVWALLTLGGQDVSGGMLRWFGVALGGFFRHLLSSFRILEANVSEKVSLGLKVYYDRLGSGY